MTEKLETLQREKVITEASRDLADTQVEKLKSLVAEVEFNDEETFAKKVATVKESYFNKTKKIAEAADFDAVDEDEVDESRQESLRKAFSAKDSSLY